MLHGAHTGATHLRDLQQGVSGHGHHRRRRAAARRQLHALRRRRLDARRLGRGLRGHVGGVCLNNVLAGAIAAPECAALGRAERSEPGTGRDSPKATIGANRPRLCLVCVPCMPLRRPDLHHEPGTHLKPCSHCLQRNSVT